jgi:NAD(P)-dependent dehydrogenase (short-subunit alcohol dehydrogenase family)
VKELSGRVAVVTGAAGGIGRALCLEFARAGMDVALADRDAAGMATVASEVRAIGTRSIEVETDVTDPQAIEALLARTLAELGSCHVIANNAGVFHAAPLVETPTSEWQRVIDVNLWGVVNGSRIFGAHFVRQGSGHILNTSSAAGLFPIPGMGPYSTTKFAIVGLSLQLRWELAPSGVGVTVMCPGVVKTRIAMRPGVGLEHVDMEKATSRSPLPEPLARKAVRAVRKNTAMVRYAPDSYLFSLLRLLPLWLTDPLGHFMGRTALKTIRKPEQLGERTG